jgi:4-hydroxy-3-polyprenylbenzoate decarboxylase
VIYKDLREFISFLARKGDLVRVKVPVEPSLEVAEIIDRLVRNNGPAIVFENVKGYTIPVVANLFGSLDRVAWGLGIEKEELEDIGKFVAYLQRPDPPEGLLDVLKKAPFFKKVLSLTPKIVKKGLCQEIILKGEDVDLTQIPVIKCWPGDVAPLITWPLVITKAPDDSRRSGTNYNVGVYRMQLLDKEKTVMRWLSQRGGARHCRMWKEKSSPMPVAVAIGCEPATILAAVTPVPENVGEFHFAGILRKQAVELVDCVTVDLKVPATSEIVLEGEIYPDDETDEGPYGDHTGYYNPQEKFPVFHVKCITHRKNPLYMTTITGKPPKEDAIIALALNRIFLPTLKLHLPEVVDFSLPMEAISYRIAVVSIKKQYPGHARRVMMGIWGFLKQFLYVKYIFVVDDDIDVHNWSDVIWALATRVDPARDSIFIENTPIDYLDFSSPVAELGSKMGIDATVKSPPEVTREWGKKIVMAPEIVDLVNKRWKEYGFE